MIDDLVAYLQITPWPLQPGVVFWSALVLVAGGSLGELVFRKAGLPRIVGYSAVGMAIAVTGYGAGAYYLGGVVRVIVDLALGLLLFELGSRVSLRWLRANPALLCTSLAEALFSFLAVFVSLRWMGLSLNVALTCATLTMATSAAVIGRVASELHSAGQVTERMVIMTALNTLFAVLLHKLILAWLHLDRVGDWTLAITQPLYTFGGSFLVAALLCGLVSWIARRLDLRDENSVLLLLGLIMLALTTARMFKLSTLLVPLLAGVMLRNTSDRPWVWSRHFGTAGGVLVLMLFVIVGASWSVQSLVAGGAVAVVLLLVRTVAKGLVVTAGARWSGISLRQSLALTLALTPISGTALVLLAELQLSHPIFAMQVAPIVFSAIAIMELLGPIVVQWALRVSGELPHSAARKKGAQP
ncbi:cation:proton antiporter [Rhodoferax sp. AJA081-3]|uniref:cation:proton antiporter n=1 Tax=Rhodoferax sp. AJA081-3 TaxID=2752316 RepID=UPI001ADFEB6D|nr:cation:proton antiporter [Rhodoferax sp. AJA081-3]QTN26167.1 cation:proton antiporter [Rhodoferax sp. AJA081-3]